MSHQPRSYVCVCVCSSDVSVGRHVITTIPHTQFCCCEGWRTLTQPIHPLRRIFTSSVLYEFYRWSISFARELHRIPAVNMSRCITATSNRSFVPHAVHFHMKLLNFHCVVCFPSRFVLGTCCSDCLQSHLNSLSTHDKHNATLEQWHFDMG